jgi:hypothetical protein
MKKNKNLGHFGKWNAHRCRLFFFPLFFFQNAQWVHSGQRFLSPEIFGHGQKDFCDPNSPDFEKKIKALKSPDLFFTTVTEVAKI